MSNKMKFVHLRDNGSKSVCGHRGVHTTKDLKKVTCQICSEKKLK